MRRVFNVRSNDHVKALILVVLGNVIDSEFHNAFSVDTAYTRRLTVFVELQVMEWWTRLLFAASSIGMRVSVSIHPVVRSLMPLFEHCPRDLLSILSHQLTNQRDIHLLNGRLRGDTTPFAVEGVHESHSQRHMIVPHPAIVLIKYTRRFLQNTQLIPTEGNTTPCCVGRDGIIGYAMEWR